MTTNFIGSQTFRRRSSFKELSTVRLTVDRQVNGGRLPAGSEGAVVFVHRNGEAYEVEFVEPIPAVLTVTASELTQ